MNLKKNIIYNIVYQMLLLMVPFITMPYISRVIGLEGVGIYSYTSSISSYFVLFAMLGLNNYANRSIAKVRDNKEELSKTFWEIYILQLINATIVLLCYLFFIFFLSNEYKTMLIIQIILLFSSVIDINWFYFGIEQFKLTTTRNMVIKILSTILIFILVKTESDLTIYVYINVLSVFLSQFILWFFLKQYVDIRLPRIVDIKRHIKPTLLLFIPVLSISVYRMMDKVMIGHYVGVDATGLYSSADRIVTIPLAIITAIGTVLLPRISNMVANKEIGRIKNYIRNSMQFSNCISIGMVFGIAAISERFSILYFGQEFSESGKMMFLLSPILLFSSWANIIRTQYLIPNEKDREYIVSVILGALINFIINISLIMTYGAIGAIVGTLCAELTVTCYQTIVSRENLDISIYIKDSYFFIASGLIMFFLVKIIETAFPISILSLVFTVFVGIVSYTFFSLIFMRVLSKNRYKYVKKILLSDIQKLLRN